MSRDSLNAECIMAEYHKGNETDTVFLQQSPVIYERNTTISGTKMFLTFRNKEIDELVVLENAEARMFIDELDVKNKYQKLRGKKITIRFLNSMINQLRADRNAEAIYYIVEDGVMQGANFVQGESIAISIENNKMKNVQVDGSNQGVFYPPHLISDLEE